MTVLPRQLWQDLPEDLWSLAYDNGEARVILDALASDDELVGKLLDVLRATVKHVDRLHARIDELPDPETVARSPELTELVKQFPAIQLCCCAYDNADDVCSVHHGRANWMSE